MSASGQTAGALPPRPLSAPPEVLAAIATAVEMCWPRGEVAGPGTSGRKGARGGPEYVWRFSGRWWQRPVALRRDRPWAEQDER